MYTCVTYPPPRRRRRQRLWESFFKKRHALFKGGTLFPILFSITLTSPPPFPTRLSREMMGYNTTVSVGSSSKSFLRFGSTSSPSSCSPRCLEDPRRARPRWPFPSLDWTDWVARFCGVGNDHRADRAPNDDSNEKEQQKAAFFRDDKEDEEEESGGLDPECLPTRFTHVTATSSYSCENTNTI